MSKIKRCFIAPIIFAILLASTSGFAFSAEKLLGGDIGCKWPVSPNETGQAVVERYGKQARVAELADIEGENFFGLMLYPDKPELQLEIETKTETVGGKVSALNLRQTDSKWTAFGLAVGMTLEDVTKANGGPLDLWGFQQFGRGGVHSVLGYFRPGKLEGGCRLLVVFTAPPGTVDFSGPLYGQDHLASDNADLLKVRPLVTELDVSWEPPPQ